MTRKRDRVAPPLAPPPLAPPLTLEDRFPDVVPGVDCCCVTGWPVGPWRALTPPGGWGKAWPLAPPLTLEDRFPDVVPGVDCCCVTGWPVGPWRAGMVDPRGLSGWGRLFCELLRCCGGMLLRCVGMLICGRSMLKCGCAMLKCGCAMLKCGCAMLKRGMLNGPALAAPLGANANVPTIAK